MSGERYQVHSSLGAGGLGTVHRAYDHQLQRWVAIKRLRVEGGMSDVQLRQEATTLASLHHPNVVTVYDFGQDAEGPYVVMELIEGETLDQFVARGVLTPEDFVELARQCLEGVQAAHHLGLVHHDLKPGNVMVSWLPSGKFHVTVLDFGLARFSVGPRRQTLDHTESLFGSVFYMAPEQFRKDLVDLRADLYSLGVMFYHALAGTAPFDGDSVAAVIAAHLQHDVVPLRQRRPDVTPSLADWVMWLINLEAAQRPANTEAALASLNRLVTAPVRPVSTTVPVSGLSSRGRSLPWVPIGLGAAVIIGVAGWFSRPRPAANTAVADRAPAAADVATDAPAPPAVTIIPVDDLERLRTVVGQVVTVSGVPVKVSESRTGKVRYLNFNQDHRRAVALVFFTADPDTAVSRETLQGYVGRPVNVTGRVDERDGAFQIIVRELSVIRVRP
jgi:serine/threonine-protein kinase